MGRWSEKDALDPESAGPQGTMALVTILREQGVEVVVARDRATALSALGPGHHAGHPGCRRALGRGDDASSSMPRATRS